NRLAAYGTGGRDSHVYQSTYRRVGGIVDKRRGLQTDPDIVRGSIESPRQSVRKGEVMTATMNNVVEIIEFTDPVCTWCWGSEPVLRKLETRFGEQVKISFVMAGLVKDITSFYDRYNDIGGDPARSNTNIARHWLEASERHGMPVQSEGFKLFSKEYPSTYPQNIAYKAAQLQDQLLANRFLRRIREASAAEAKLTNTTEVLV